LRWLRSPAMLRQSKKRVIFTVAYHVLLGSISPLEGRGPSDLKIDGLIQRIKQGGLKEIIIATDADTEGETTAMYLTQLLNP